METKIRILLADANPDFGKLLEDTLAAERDLELVGTAGDGPETLTKLQEGLKEGKSVRLLDLDDNDREWIRNYGLLTAKPVIYVANMGE